MPLPGSERDKAIKEATKPKAQFLQEIVEPENQIQEEEVVEAKPKRRRTRKSSS